MRPSLPSGFSLAIVVALSSAVYGQFDVLSFDPTSTGPWSDVELTTAVVPQVVDGGVTLDGKPGGAEYGGFEGITVTPGDNAWLLDFPGDRQWDGPEDSSFTFWLAHDTTYLYVGIDAKDDVVNSDDPNAQFWRDDAIEIVTDVWNDNYDNNTDSSNDAYGGHSYINFEGRFSGWDEEGEVAAGGRWSSALESEWTYGEEGDIFGFGEETETGWNMEVRFNKRLFEDPEADIKLVEGARMGFNIGMDDDDKFGPGENGDGSRTQDLELQYFWANRERFIGWNEAEDDGFYSEEEIAESFERLGNGTIDEDEALSLEYDWGINSAGRLSHGGTGEIIFGGLAASVPGDCNGDGAVDAVDLQCVDSVETRDIVLAALNTLPGDLDGVDGVAFADFLTLSGNFGNETATYAEGNVDLMGGVEFADFLALSGNFGQTPPAASAIPEPSSVLLAAFGVLGLLSLRRRSR